MAFDAPMQLATKEYIRLKQPRVLFVGYGETDEWAHARRYDLTLRSAHAVDAFVADPCQDFRHVDHLAGRRCHQWRIDHA